MLDKKQLRELVIEVLTDLQMISPSAVNLILGTHAKEGIIAGNVCLRQVGGGPALGMFQIEPTTETDCWRYLNRADKAEIKSRFVISTGVSFASPRQLKSNLAYGIALARVKYWMDKEALPAPDDIAGMARTWKRVYNAGGKGTEQEFIDAYKRYVL